MPELPEVETLRRSLLRTLPGSMVTEVIVRKSRLRRPVKRDNLQKLLVGQKVMGIDRRSKYLLIRFANKSSLLIHLGMSGRLLVRAVTDAYEKHDHVIFQLDDSRQLRFLDPRRFGLVEAYEESYLHECSSLKNLGCEPLGEDFSADFLFARTRRRNKPLKSFLMDAQEVVGVGNIYANEALYQAKIHPAKRASRLKMPEAARLCSSVRAVLTRAIERGGTTISDFRNSDGESGYFQLDLSVYDREGKACRRCKETIRRIVLAGRSTYFCPGCQKR